MATSCVYLRVHYSDGWTGVVIGAVRAESVALIVRCGESGERDRTALADGHEKAPAALPALSRGR